MPKFVPEIVGGLEIAGGAAIDAFVPGGQAIGNMLIAAGVGSVISGLGTLLTPGPIDGFATTLRNPVAPWQYCYGRVRTGGTLIYFNQWPQPGEGAGGNDQIWDLVFVVAAHQCESIDAVLFDLQRVQIQTRADATAGGNDPDGAAPGGADPSSGTSFTPVQQTVNITSISRSNGVVTVTLPADIPYLTEGDQIKIQNVPGDLTLNGTFPVAQILSQVQSPSPGSIVFTYLSGGEDSDVTSAGQAVTLWADYGRTVYFEPMLGTQTLGESFAGMGGGTPLDGDPDGYVSPDHTGGVQGADEPNPWTNYCSGVGLTMIFLRIHYNAQYYKGGLPQISFLLHGKNNILDPRVSISPPSLGYTENAALCWADYLSLPYDFGGYGLQYGTQIPYADLEAAANTCDEQVALAAPATSPPQYEPAYTCNGKFTLDKPRGEILQNLLTCMGGPVAKMTWIGGQARVYPAAWIGNSWAIGSNPGGGVIALGSFTSLAADGFEWSSFPAGREVYNGVKGTYISQAAKWQAVDIPPYAQDSDHGYDGPSQYEGDENLAADQGVRRWYEHQLPFTISAATAQRISKITLLWLRAWGRGTFRLKMAAYQMTPPDLLTMVVPYLGSAWGGGSPFTPKQLEIEDLRLTLVEGKGEGDAPAVMVEIDVKETDTAIYDWSTTEELSPQGYVQPQLPGSSGFQFFATETVPGFNVPYPLMAGYVAPLVGDALYPGPVVGSPQVNQGPGSFGLQVSYENTESNGDPAPEVLIKGTPPPNQPSVIEPPQIYGAAAGTSGQLAPGTYWITASAVDPLTPPHDTKLATPIRITVPAPSPVEDSGSITFTLQWPWESNGGNIYMSMANPNQPGGLQAGATGWFLQKTLPFSSSPTSVTITAFDQSTPGAPDGQFDHAAVAWRKGIHLGCWAQQVQAVTSNTITIAGAGMTADQWSGRVLTLLGKLDSTQELIILNMPVESSTESTSPGGEFTLTIGPNSAGDQLPDLTTLLVEGDLVVMRFSPTFTAQGFSDALIANPYYPSGANDTSIEPGHQVIVRTGPDAGDVQTIASVQTDGDGNYTVFELASPWTVQPNDGDIIEIVDGAWGPEYEAPSVVATANAVSGILAAVPISNLANQQWVFILRSENAQDQNGPDTFAQIRSIYVFGSQGTRTITTSQTMLATDRIIDADASGISPAGPLTYTLLPFADIPNQSIFVQKVDDSANSVEVAVDPSSGDSFNDGQSTITLANYGDNVLIIVSGS